MVQEHLATQSQWSEKTAIEWSKIERQHYWPDFVRVCRDPSFHSQWPNLARAWPEFALFSVDSTTRITNIFYLLQLYARIKQADSSGRFSP